MKKIVFLNLFDAKQKIYVFVFLFLVLIAIFYSLLLNNVIGKGVVLNGIQSSVKSFEKLSHESNTQIFLDFKTSKKTFDILKFKTTESPEIEYFLYENNNLISWTTSQFTIPISVLLHQHNRIYEDSTGLYLLAIDTNSNLIAAACVKLVTKFPFNNKYLKQEHAFSSGYIQRFEILNIPTEYSVYGIDNSYLFSLDFSKRKDLNANQILTLLVLMILILFFFVFIVSGLLEKNKIKLDVIFLSILIFMVFLRLFMTYFSEPWIVYQTELFQPTLFASTSIFYTSLGDGVFIIVLGFILTAILFKNYFFNDKNFSLKETIIIYILLIINAYNLLISLHDGVYNSKISINLIDISGLSTYSLLIYIVIATAIISSILNILLLKKLIRERIKVLNQIGISLPFISFLFLFLYFDTNFIWIILGFIGLLLFFLIDHFKFHLKFSNVLILCILVFGFSTNLYINNSIPRSIDLKNKALLLQLSNNQDPEFEFKFYNDEKSIYRDSSLQNLLLNDTVQYSHIESYLRFKYFNNSDFVKKYDLQITICNQSDKLDIRPENLMVNCNQYFLGNLINYGKLTNQSKNLYRLELGSGQINYLGLVRFRLNDTDKTEFITIYFEVNSKLKRKGFTKILSEEGSDPFEKIEGFSFGHYLNDSLVESYGRFKYPNHNFVKTLSDGDYFLFNRNGFHHQLYQSENNHKYILSKKNIDYIGIIAPFIYIIFILISLFVLYLCLYDITILYKLLNTSFKIRLQLSIFLLLMVTFILLSYLSLVKIVNLSDEKNMQNVTELTRILKIEFENKIERYDGNNEDYLDYINQLVLKFNKIFETDINLYDINGELISSSRPELIQKQLKSRMISPSAWYALKKKNGNSYFEKESIGDFAFYSSYAPLKTQNEAIIGYLNVPYFSKQEDLSNEINGFISTLFNVYALIISLSFVLAIIISRFISKPLSMVAQKMGKISLGQKNEKIIWQSNDEIGMLIIEYNKMLDDLAAKAELLAISERSNAWTEMAKQVAHEIRNPLTPMKLSVQFLQKSWQDSDESFDERLKKFSSTMIGQIDSLNEIANSFSEFAKMPEMEKTSVDISKILENAIALFDQELNPAIQFYNKIIPKQKSLFVYANEGYLLRVFTNILKNAIQAINETETPQIIVHLNQKNEMVLVEFHDNGCGIEDDVKERIFTPYFTTKSGGTGLGLAMCKNIINDFRGEISFESKAGKGTSFYILLPVLKE